jgi:hypothetical protein
MFYYGFGEVVVGWKKGKMAKPGFLFCESWKSFGIEGGGYWRC